MTESQQEPATLGQPSEQVDVETLKVVLDITRQQLNRSMALSAELEALLVVERERSKKLAEKLDNLEK